MAAIRKKNVSGKDYYYLEHSYRDGKIIKKKELYLGQDIPQGIEKVKKEFLNEIYKERWFKILAKIKEGHADDVKSTPLSSREKELQTFVIKFTYDTQRIEGSTLTLRETANLLERGISPKEKPIRDVKEAEAHRKLFYEMLGHKRDLSLDTVLFWHRQLFISTKPDIAGKIRKHGVAISGSRFVPPTPVEVTPLLTELFRWYHKNKGKMHPVELAARVHLRFVTIHPFSDGNGRISRLMMSFVLHKHKYPMLDIAYENRNSYYNALERSQIKGDENIFLQWYIKRYIKDNRKHL